MPIKPIHSCKFCSSLNSKTFSAEERMLGLAGAFIYQQCVDCGSLQLQTIPEDLSKFYPETYYSFAELVPSSSMLQFLKKRRMELFLSTGLSFLSPSYGNWLYKIKPNFHDKIADIGCGNGQLLYELWAAGFKHLEGFDPFIKKDRNFSDSLKLWKKPIQESKTTFDLIMMHHAFEHMHKPEGILKTAYEKLRPGGKLLIRTPVSDSEVFQVEGSMWVQLDAPRHLVIPSIKGFKELAEKVGFQLNEVEFDSDSFQFKGTELYKMGKTLNKDLLENTFTKKEEKEFNKKAFELNKKAKGDQVCFYLTKLDFK